MEEDTIFDLASTTKGFTAIAILKLLEMGLIDNLQDDIIKYAPQFENLKGITIYDLFSFRISTSYKFAMSWMIFSLS